MKKIISYFLFFILPILALGDTSQVSYYIQSDKSIESQYIIENEHNLFQVNPDILYKAILPSNTLWITNFPEQKLFEHKSNVTQFENGDKNFLSIGSPSLTTLVGITSFSSEESQRTLLSWIALNAFYYGALTLLILYVIFFNHIFSHKSFVIYQYFHIALMILLLDSDGWLQKILWSDHPELSRVTIPIFMIISTILLVFFSRILLQIRENAKSLDTIILSLMTLNFLSLLLIFFVPAERILWIVTLSVLVTISATLYTTIYVFFSGDIKNQKSFIVVWIALLIAMVAEYCRYLGFIPTNPYTLFMLKITLFIELITVSMIIITNRLEQLEKDKEEIRNQARENEHELTQKNFDTKRLQQKHDLLNKLAGTDGLTGLYNRREFINIAESLIFRAKNNFEPYCFMMLDLDHFKNVNDTYGHDVGDIVLKSVTKRVTEGKREEDVFGRIGGEEFALFMPNTTLEVGEESANNLCKIISKHPIDIGEKILYVTMSIGLASDAHRIATLSELMKTSDIGLYEAKRNGRNKVVSLECTR